MAAAFCETQFHGLNQYAFPFNNLDYKFGSYSSPMNDSGSVTQRWNSLSPDPHSGTESTASTPFVKSEFPFDDDLFGVDQVNNLKQHPIDMHCNIPIPTIEYNRRFSKDAIDTSFVKNEVEENILNFNVNPEIAQDNGLDTQQMDIYRDLILRHLIQDISTTCAKLGLPTDFYVWTAEHGARWINEMCQQFSLQQPRNCFITGRVLLGMNQKDFEMFLPDGGDTLHAQLQVWKTAFESYHPPVTVQSSGLTAADNNMQTKSDWMANTNNQTNNMAATENAPTHSFFNGNGGYTNMSMGSFFQQGTVLPSPSNSDTSSNGSSQDMNDDDIDLQMNNSNCGLNNFFHHPGYMSSPIDSMCNGSEGDDDERAYTRHQGTVHLWQFIRELLDQPKQYSACVRWVDRDEGTFKIESSLLLARYWGQRKNRSQMNYDKLSRSLRQYYKKGIIQKPEKKQRLVYKFLPPYNL